MKHLNDRKMMLRVLASALSLSILAAAFLLKNQFGLYPLHRLIYLPLLLVLALPFTLLAADRARFVWPVLPAARREVLLIALALLPVTAWLLPLPLPALPARHQLQLFPAQGTRVELHGLTDLNGSPIPSSILKLTPDWRQEGDVIYTNSAPGSQLAFDGVLAGGAAVRLRYFDEGGPVTMIWDGVEREIDLSAKESWVLVTELRSTLFQAFRSNPLPALAGLGLVILELAGLYLLLLIGTSAVYRVTRPGAAQVILAGLVLAGLLAGFFQLKLAGLQADMPRTFRDTYDYIVAAELPLTSSQFWAGTRAFGLPLFLKLLGTTTANYASGEQMQRIAYIQTALSAISWSIFAAIIALAAARNWLGRVFVFGLLLFFSLSLEIGLWDPLLLTESLDLSLLALMFSAWVVMFVWLPSVQRPAMRWAILVGSILLTVWFSFTRDSNIYFVFLAALIPLIFWLAGWHKARRTDILVFSAAVLMLFVVQNLSLIGGNRWQIFMYDHLAMRFLRDPQATQFFAAEGLPISDRLMETTGMIGHVYQPLYKEAPDFQPVRDWVATRSKSAYLKYLLSRPIETLVEPLVNADKLLWGSNLEYRSPLGGVTPAPARLAFLTGLFFPHRPFGIALLVLAALAGTYIAWRASNPLWVLQAILLLTIYPMMFIVWHGEPLEIERHAMQIMLQFYLAGWIGMAVLALYGFRRLFFGQGPIHLAPVIRGESQ